jgi:isoleucyl-tRNA synthetase
LDWKNPELESEMQSLLKVRTEVNGKIEPMRAAGKLGKALDASLTIKSSSSDHANQALIKHKALLAELFIVSQVELTPKPDSDSSSTPIIEPIHSQELGFIRCPRCWRWLPKLETTSHGDICPRCNEALAS